MSDPLLPGPEIPLLLKIVLTTFVAILIPIYWWYYGPGNFLWFSDLALFLSTAALWLESPLIASTQAVSVGLLEVVWLTDFLARLLRLKLIGLSEYMFDRKIPPFIRGLSLFHVALPFLVFWLVWELGYDTRALLVQTILAWLVLLTCYFLTDPKENVNWVFGWGKEKQTVMSPFAYLLLVLAVFPVCIYLPSHFLLEFIMPPAIS